MAQDGEDWLPTRASLLERLKDWQDHASWREFFDIYGRLIYSIARKSGLTDLEAQDAVQETLLQVAKQMPGFKYDPGRGSFKAWLLNQTRWRITDQFRNRLPLAAGFDSPSTTTSTSMINRVPDPASFDLDAAWVSEWERSLLAAAEAKVRARVQPRQYQIFDLYVHHEWPPEKVAAAFSVSTEQVYLTKHRVLEMIKAEAKRLDIEVI